MNKIILYFTILVSLLSWTASHLDRYKAFDIAPHPILVLKLGKYWFEGCTIPWIKSWLGSHRQSCGQGIYIQMEKTLRTFIIRYFKIWHSDWPSRNSTLKVLAVICLCRIYNTCSVCQYFCSYRRLHIYIPSIYQLELLVYST